MTTSLPSFLSEMPAGATASAAPATTVATAATPMAPLDFAQLLAAPETAAVALGAPVASTEISASAPEHPAPSDPSAPRGAPATIAPRHGSLLRGTVGAAAAESAPVGPAASHVPIPAESASAEGAPDRAMLEQALALLLPLWSAEMPVPVVPIGNNWAVPQSALVAESRNRAGESVFPGVNNPGIATPAPLMPTVPGARARGSDVGAPGTNQTSATAASEAVFAAHPEVTPSQGLDDPGARKAALLPSQAPPMETAPDASAPRSMPAGAAAEAIKGMPWRAEVRFADGTMLAVASEEPVVTMTPGSMQPARATAPANNAAAAELTAQGATDSKPGREKKSLTLSPATLNAGLKEAGIGVAIPSVAMSAPAPVLQNPVAPTLSVVATEAGNLMSPVSGSSLAARAVHAVVEVVEAQAASRLQPSPSVQLRFRIGSEDLAVRIELRGGEVRTEFRTESPELRAAVAHEWRAATAVRPELSVRLAEPVFSAAQSGNTAGSGTGSSHQQGQAFSQHAAPGGMPEHFGRVARRFPAPSASEAPAAPIVPLTSASSRRLSAVA